MNLQFFKYPEDRTPILIFTALFALDLAAFFMIENRPLAVAWMLLGIIPKGYICAWGHHHQHCFTFKQPILNRLLEIMYFFQTGICGYLWVLHHVYGHHLNYLDQTKDESRWKDLKTGRKMNPVRYTLEVSLTSHHRAFVVGRNYPKLQRAFLAMATLSYALLISAFFYNWFNALFILAIPAFVSLNITSYATYDHHSGLETQDPYAASNNILNTLYNKLTGNLGLHTAHHTHFGAHWSLLPQIHQKIQHKIPSHCYYEAGFPTKYLSRSQVVASSNRATAS